MKLLIKICIWICIVSIYSKPGICTYAETDLVEPIDIRIDNIDKLSHSTVSKLIHNASIKLHDYNKQEWYAIHVAKIVGIGAINGYPDNTFRPNTTITNAEFISMLIGTLYGKQQRSCECHWASGFIEKAIEEHILMVTDITENNVDRPINREEMALYVVRASIAYYREEYSDFLSNYKVHIKDYDNISVNPSMVLAAYSKGIVNGYPDGNFRPSHTATRAEASAIIINLIDNSMREEKELPVIDDGSWRSRKTVMVNGYTVPVEGTTRLTIDECKDLNDLDKGYSEIAFDIKVWEINNRAEQFDAVFNALKSKFGEAIAQQCIDYLDIKKKREDELKRKEIIVKEKDRSIVMYSDKGAYIIVVQIFKL